jgi:hypothetical protein
MKTTDAVKRIEPRGPEDIVEANHATRLDEIAELLAVAILRLHAKRDANRVAGAASPAPAGGAQLGGYGSRSTHVSEAKQLSEATQR